MVKKPLNYIVFIDERISNLQSSIKSFKVLSIVLAIVAITILIFAFFSKNSLSEEMARFGFGLITMILPYYLLNESLKRKNKVSSLKFIKGQLELNPEINDELIKKAFEEI